MGLQNQITLIAFLFLCAANLNAAPWYENRSIIQLPLDNKSVYTVEVGKGKVTTFNFPGRIKQIDAGNADADGKSNAPFTISWSPGEHYFSARAKELKAETNVNVIYKNSTYVIRLVASKAPKLSVTFYDAREQGRMIVGGKRVHSLSETKMLSMLDTVKAMPLLHVQYPEISSQVRAYQPARIMYYKGFKVLIDEVFKFEQEDAIAFRILFHNETDEPIYYQPHTLGVRIGTRTFYQKIADASGVMVPNQQTPAYFLIAGNADGSRANLALKNNWNILVRRVQQTTLIAQ